MEGVFGSIDMPDLLTRIDFAKLQRDLAIPGDAVTSKKLEFRKMLGMPDDFHYATAFSA